MKKKLFIVSLIAIFFVCLFSFTTLNVSAQSKTSEEMVNEELDNINLPNIAIIDFPVPYISVYNSTIEWESENPELLNVPQEGGWVKVTRPEVDTDVVLTVTITNGEYSNYKEFTITVLKGNTLTNTYNINYVLNDGTQNQNNPTTYKVGTDVELFEPTKGRVEFLGWYLNPEFEGEEVTALPKGTSGDITLYAKWDKAVVEKIEVVTQPTKVVYNALEQFDPTGIVVKAYYNDDLTEEVVEFDELSFSETVLHGNVEKVTVAYGNFTDEIDVTVNKLEYDLTQYFKDTTVTYNGEYQTITSATALPEGLVVEIQGGSTNATEGVEVNVIVKEYNEVDYNQPKNITVTLTVEKAKLVVKVNPAFANLGAEMPVFSATFEGLKGNDKAEDLGTLVFESEAKDTATEGKFEVTASGLESENYDIEYQAGTFTVSDGQFVIYVDPAELTKTYDGTTHMISAVVMSGSEQLDVDSIVYEYDGATFNGAVNAGEYLITIKFYDAQYGTGETAVTLKINKAVYDLSGIEFNNGTVEYNGSVQGLVIEGTLPEGVEVSYTEGLKEVGSKKITASFVGDTTNHEAITLTLEATLTVTAKALAENMFEAIPNQSYTGSAITPTIKGSFANSDLVIGVDIEVSYANNIEQGTAQVIVEGIGNFQGEVTLTFEIGESDLVKAETAKEELEESYVTNELPEAFVTETENGAKVTWFSTSTALSVNANGEITTIQTNEVQYVLVYALIVVNNSAEYTAFEFVVPALEQGQEPEQPDEPEQVEAETVDFSTQGYENAQDISEFDLKNAHLVFSKGTNTNSGPKYYNTGTALRLYGGNTLTISSANKIVKVELTFSSGEGSNNILVNVGEYSDGVVTISEGTNELILTVEGTSGHRRIKTITVHYYSATGEQPDEPDQPTHEHTVCPTCGGCTATECDGTLEKCPGHPVEPEQPTHEHVKCPTCGGCTAEDCDGLDTEKCPGHTQEPEQPEPGQTVEATLTFDSTDKRTEFDTSHQVWKENGITLTNNKGTGNNIADYANPARFYKSSEIIIEANGNITKLVFTCNTAAYATSLSTSISGSTVDGKVVTVVLDGSSKSATYTLSDGQVRVDSLTVTYVGESGTTPEEPEQPSHEHTVCTTCGGCTATECDGTLTKCPGHTQEPEQPKHEHVACPTCGKCTAEDCDGTDAEKCPGHTQQPEPGQTVEATLTFDSTDKRTEFDTSHQVWKENGITLTNNKSASTNDVADYAKPVRLYANSEIVIEATGITKIVFDCNSGSYATALGNSIGTVEGATVTVNSDKVTVELTSAVNSFTIAKLTGQVRLDSITVTHN